MDFDLKPEHQALRRFIREFVQEEIRPLVKQIDRTSLVPDELLKKAAAAGLFGIPFSQKYGGMGAGEMGYCILMEELGRADASTTAIIGAHTGIGVMTIYLDGTEELKRRYLPDLCTGRKIAAFALTEANAGSDAAAIRMKAVREGDSYMLDGEKMWITNGPIADVLTVLAITDPSLGARGGATCFAVESKQEGFSAGKREEKMGLHGSPTAALKFDNVRVPQENVIGKVGLGFVTMMKTLDVGRVSLGAATLGGAQAALEAAMQWAKTRFQFGRNLANMQSIQFMVADMAAEIEALRSLVYRTAWLVDAGRPFTKEAGMCKLLGSEIASRCIDRALQIHGALGFTRDGWVERAWRDSRINEIFEGTNEIQRIVIASELFQGIGVRIRP
ncbi:MAG: acyl-CoA dehydrogenase domain protein [Chloroflexi bacterium]|nr:acyl-CoA dehydrogenase domain protein [Chloroflexota bacterium]